MFSYFDNAISLIQWLYSFVLGAYVLSWSLRKRESGQLLLSAGGFSGAKYVSWAGMMLGAIALALIGNFIFKNGLSLNVFWREDISALVFFSGCLLLLGKNKLELRENGICNFYRFYPWDRMKSYEWGVRRTTMMTVRYDHHVIFFLKAIGFEVPKRYRDDVDRIVKRHIPTTPIPSQELG